MQAPCCSVSRLWTESLLQGLKQWAIKFCTLLEARLYYYYMLTRAIDTVGLVYPASCESSRVLTFINAAWQSCILVQIATKTEVQHVIWRLCIKYQTVPSVSELILFHQYLNVRLGRCLCLHVISRQVPLHYSTISSQLNALRGTMTFNIQCILSGT